MHFPSDMNFQYFFFDTYPGYFLQALPIAIIVAAIWYVIRLRKDKNVTLVSKFWSCTFVCYMTGLICLVDLLYLMKAAWYLLIYHADSGITFHLFDGAFNLLPDFYNHLDGEAIGNLLMFLPFCMLYPLSHPCSPLRKTSSVGILWVAFIEICQPILGRSFDINDVILNTLGIAVSATLYFLGKRVLYRKQSS